MTEDTEASTQFKRILQTLEDSGMDAKEYERIIGMQSLTGGEGVINSETTEMQALLLAIMEAINDPRLPDGSIDDTIAYDCPVLRTFNNAFKTNMISNKRKGRMELVKVMRGEEEDEGITSRIRRAVSGED